MYNFGTTKIVQNHYKTIVSIPTILPLGVTYVEPPHNKESTRSLELAAQAAKSNNKVLQPHRFVALRSSLQS